MRLRLHIRALSINIGVALPAARSGIGVGIVLGAGRALGETMAIVMVMGNVVQIPTSLFDPARTLTANIALEMAYASSAHRSALFVSGRERASSRSTSGEVARLRTDEAAR